MLNEAKIIGIDLARMENEQAVYAVYESTDGGERWKSLHESSSICELLEFAKYKYANETPLVMQQHIQDILRVQIIEEYRYKKQVPPPKPKNWLVKFMDFFRRR